MTSELGDSDFAAPEFANIDTDRPKSAADQGLPNDDLLFEAAAPDLLQLGELLSGYLPILQPETL